MQYSPISDNITKELHTQVEEGYTNLAKWIIALSTGAIAFGASLVKPETTIVWKEELFFGLFMLGISILAGVRYVRLRIDGVLFNLEVILNQRQLEAIKRNNPNNISIEKHDKRIKETETKMERINKDLVTLSNLQQILFYLGIGSIMIFGVLGR